MGEGGGDSNTDYEMITVKNKRVLDGIKKYFAILLELLD